MRSAEVSWEVEEGFEQQDRAGLDSPRKPLARNAGLPHVVLGPLLPKYVSIVVMHRNKCVTDQFSSDGDLSRSEMQGFLRNAEKCANLGSYQQLPDSSVI